MNTPRFTITLSAFVLAAAVSTNLSHAQTAVSPVPAPTPYTVVTRDANSAVWERTVYEPGPSGQAVPTIHRYTELASGLNHLVNGQYVASKEEIALSPDGTSAEAINGAHRAFFPNDIAAGVIELDTPDSLKLLSRPIAISYDDGSNTVLIAILTNSVGYLVGANQVVYPNAFSGINGSIRYTYTKAGIEQDIILESQPIAPHDVNLNPQTTRLQVLTEFFNPPPPVVTPTTVPTAAGELADQRLDFGGVMKVVPGKAFLLGTNSPAVAVGKQWTQIGTRQFLVEEVPIPSIADELLQLPPSQTTSTKPNPPLYVVSAKRLLPPQHLAKTSPEGQPRMRMAQSGAPAQGLVLDYQTINGSLTNCVFQGDTTYFLSGAVYLYGTNTFEGGAVIKYTNNVALNLPSAPPVNWLAAAYRPVVFTAVDDNSVAETISVSTGNPAGKYYANPALSIFGSSGQTLSNFRIAYAQQAIMAIASSGNINLYNGQLVKCQTGINCSYANVNVRNMLFANVQTNFNISLAGVYVQNATFSSNSILGVYSNPGSLSLNNCILANVSQLTNGPGLPYSSISGDHNGFYNSPVFGTAQVTTNFYPFQTVGGGSYYLTNGCVFRNAGTTNIDPVLLASLATKTTYPPIVYSNVTFSVATNFSPQAKRDTNATLDLGYHYDPLDYVFGATIAASNLTFTAGTAVGYFYNSAGGSYALALGDSVTASFNGIVIAPCQWARYNTVQEGGNGLWTAQSSLGGITGQSFSGTAPAIQAQFTGWYELAGQGNLFRDNYSLLTARAANCEFYSGNIGGYYASLNLTNCLFVNGAPVVWWNYNAANLSLENCTIIRGNLIADHTTGSTWPVTIVNCAFDRTTIYMNAHGLSTNGAYCDYNSFLLNSNTTAILGGHEVTIANGYNWQSSWLGSFYQPTNSPLIDKGSTSATNVGLYHFTTQTNQVKETNSIVDIGFHYVAVDTNGIPLDSNGNDISDYIEDTNGNGLVDGGEMNWAIAISTQPANQTVVQGSNLTFSVTARGVSPLVYQWYFNSAALANATNAALMLNNVQPTSAGTYYVIVSDNIASLTSSNATLAVLVPPSIVTQPTNQAVFPGSNTTFTVIVAGTTPLSYQWWFNGTNLIAGATNLTLTLSNVQAVNFGNYCVVVTNMAGGVASSNVSLTLLGPPVIVQQPMNQIMLQSSNVAFTVQATGTEPLYYQWQRNGSPLTNNNMVSGANSNTLTLTGLRPWSQGLYNVVVSNSLGQVTSFYAIRALSPSIAVGWGDNTYGQLNGPNGLAAVAAAAIQNDYSLTLDSLGDVQGYGQMHGFAYASATLNGISGEYDNGDALAPGASLSLNNRIAGCITCAVDSSGNSIITWPSDQAPQVTIGVFNQYTGGSMPLFTVGHAIGLGPNGNLGSGTIASYSGPSPLGFQQSGILVVTINSVLSSQAGNPWPSPSSIYYAGINFNATSFTPSTAPMSGGIPTINFTLTQNFTGNVGDTLQIGSATMTVTSTNENTVTCQMQNNNALGQSIPFFFPFTSVPRSDQILTNNSASGSLTTVATYPLNDGSYPSLNTNADYPIDSFMEFPNSGIPASGIVPSPSPNTVQPDMTVQLTNPDGSGSAGSGDLLFVSAVGLSGGNSGPVNVPSDLTNVVAITASPNSSGYDDFALALKNDGTVEEWDLTGPCAVPPGSTNIVAVAAGDRHSLALRGDGRVVAWGDNTYGQTNVPSNLTNAVAIAASTCYSLALRSNGTVVAWGYSIQTNVPANVAGVVAIAAGYYHSLALKTNGTVVAWKAWSTGVPAVTNVPSGLTNVVAIAAGNGYSLALKNDGTIVAWGTNAATNIPPILTNVVTIAAGNCSSMAIAMPVPPSITQQPVDFTTNQGSSAYFSVAVTNMAFLSYQWLHNETVLIWETNAALTINNVQTGNAGTYSVIVTNIAGSATSTLAQLTVLLPPVITQQPADCAVTVSGDATFNVSVSQDSATPLTYQWLFNGTNLVGATSATLTLNNVQTNNAGIYSVIVTNVAGSVTSLNALLLVLPPASWFEQYWGPDYQNNPNAYPYADADGDGISNVGEYLANTNPTNFDNAMLGCWRFNTTNWAGDQWQLPLNQTGLMSALVPGVEGSAVDLTGPDQSKTLTYRYVETNGNVNIALQSGTVILWFKPSWNGVNEGGSGPGSAGCLINLGTWTAGATTGVWRINLDSSGDMIGLDVQDNAGHEIQIPYVSIPGGMTSNQWVQIVVTYTPANTALYINGALAGTGSGLNNIVPPPSVLLEGVSVGTDMNGTGASQGAFDLLQTFNYPMALANIQANYQTAFTLDSNADPDRDGIPNGWEILWGLNPLVNDWALNGNRLNYGYTLADWLNQVFGIRSGSIDLDPEGNVLSVSQ